VADGSGRLTIARQPGRGQVVGGHAAGATLQQDLGHAGATEDGLQRAHVLVLAGMRGAHDGQLRRRQLEVVGSTRFDERNHAEGLHRRTQHHLRARCSHGALHPTLGIDLHDVAAMAAFHDLAAADLDQHGWCRALAGARGALGRLGGGGGGGLVAVTWKGRDGSLVRHGPMVSRVGADGASGAHPRPGRRLASGRWHPQFGRCEWLAHAADTTEDQHRPIVQRQGRGS
jgi:hypothetical protein